MIAHPLGIMIRIGPAALSAAHEGPRVSPSSALSALISTLPAASVPEPPEQDAPSLDASPSIGVPFAQHAVVTATPIEPLSEVAETADTDAPSAL